MVQSRGGGGGGLVSIWNASQVSPFTLRRLARDDSAAAAAFLAALAAPRAPHSTLV